MDEKFRQLQEQIDNNNNNNRKLKDQIDNKNRELKEQIDNNNRELQKQLENLRIGVACKSEEEQPALTLPIDEKKLLDFFFPKTEGNKIYDTKSANALENHLVNTKGELYKKLVTSTQFC